MFRFHLSIMMCRFSTPICRCAIAVCVFTGTSFCDDQKPAIRRIEITDRLPYGQSPVVYDSKQNHDAVAGLNSRLEKGTVKLDYSGMQGYLRAVLKALDVPVESQLLVYSKTALNPQLIGPKTPRAIYFNDEISVGWVPGTPAIEIMAMDPLKGANFYTLDVRKREAPRFVRRDNCLACHAGSTTLQVPGWMVRSFLVDNHGKPLSGFSSITHATDLSKRWGGWFVTGKHGRATHRGNVIGPKANERFRTEPGFAGNRDDLSEFVSTKRYLTPHSDIIAHLVLDHQAQGLNLITRVGYEARFGRRSDAETQLLRYLLFIDETPLTSPIVGTSGFREQFERRGPFDSRKRSLRQFDLKTRLFKYRLSYLIYTRAFDGLPNDVKHRLYKRLHNILTGHGSSPEFRKLPEQERRTILEILTATKPEFRAQIRISRLPDRRPGDILLYKPSGGPQDECGPTIPASLDELRRRPQTGRVETPLPLQLRMP